MAAGGTVKVSVRNVELAKEVKPSLSAGGKFVEIIIEDSGAGIPAHHLPQIFDPYFTTKEKGSGLGLATSYSIIRNHGGVIDAASEVNKGSSFTIYLPAIEADLAADYTQAPYSAGVRAGRILLMDDDEMIRDVARHMIESLGHEIASARDGEEAIAMFRQAEEAGSPFDIIILDLTVKGGMGGEEAIRRIREQSPTVKAVVSSGYADNPVVAAYRSYGFMAYLNKPYRIDDLRECLTRLLA
jgi:CheY-like chemotaxis protein